MSPSYGQGRLPRDDTVCAVNNDQRSPDRLRQFREEWPRHVSWAEVRAERPDAVRSALFGVLLVAPSLAATWLFLGLGMDLPFSIPLPGPWSWARVPLLIVSLALSVGLWVWAFALISIPGDTRRQLAIDRFAAKRRLRASRYGFAPAQRGILLAEGTPEKRPRLETRIPQGLAPSLYRAGFSLWAGTGSPPPTLQIAIASYTGGKNDPTGPRNGFRFLEMTLPRRLPHLMIDARGNGSLRSRLPGTQLLELEGDFNRYFSVYVPVGYERDALELLTPDVMACLVDFGRAWDIEVVDDHLIAASRKFRRRSDRQEATAMLFFAELIGAELGHQAHSYHDPRAEKPNLEVSQPGRRLRRRSGAWATFGFVLVIAGVLGFPLLLNWLLDL